MRTTLALARKAWLETRLRFMLGLVVAIAVCASMTLLRPRIVAQWRLDLIQHPEWQNPIWFDAVLNDYGYYLWHYLYQDMLQKVMAVFAILLGVGGLTREEQYGTVGITLAMPIRRRTILGVRAAVSFVQITVLALAAVATIMAGTAAIGEHYPLGVALLHAAMLLAGSGAILSLSLALSAIVEGEHAPMLIGLSAISLLYFLAAPYSDGGPEPPLVRALNLAGAMAGGPGLSGVRWQGLAVAALLAAVAIGVALDRSARRDF